MTVIPHGPVYEFQWQSGSSSFSGVGIQQGSNTAAGYDQSMQGRPCGVALFSMAGDGSLNAVWGMYGQDAAGSESWGKL